MSDQLLDTLQKTGELQDALQKMKEAGLSFGDCVAIFAADADDAFVASAREHPLMQEGTLEVDDRAVVSKDDSGDAEPSGAYVQCWLWVDAAESGID